MGRIICKVYDCGSNYSGLCFVSNLQIDKKGQCECFSRRKRK